LTSGEYKNLERKIKMTVIKKNDFIEVEYTGKTKEEGIIFDTTDEKIAKESGLSQTITKFGPISICVGAGHLLPGLETFVEGKDLGTYDVELKPEEGFGKKNAKLLQLISKAKFTKQQINPQPGIMVEVDGQRGLVKTVTGGRVIVDFNHPLSGKELIYNIKVNKIIEDLEEKVRILMNMKFQFIPLINLEIKDNKANLTVKKMNLPEEFLNLIKEEITKFTDIKEINITEEDNIAEGKKEKKTEEKKAIAVEEQKEKDSVNIKNSDNNIKKEEKKE
jgi:FKBP-type peptidyl-prolyl cis-trans isomerase SlyD